MPREMFDERIRLSDPEKFSWEKTMLPGATDKDISNKRLVDVINAGINKGRIPSVNSNWHASRGQTCAFSVTRWSDGSLGPRHPRHL